MFTMVCSKSESSYHCVWVGTTERVLWIVVFMLSFLTTEDFHQTKPNI